MVTVSADEAASQFPRLLAQVEAGEEVVIARDGAPVARIVAVAPRKRRRGFGSMRGLITIDDRFFDPLPEEELAAWEGAYEGPEADIEAGR